VQIVNNSSVDFGSITKVQINWGDTSGGSYIDTIPYSRKIYSHNYANPVSATTASYNIRMISFSGISCENELNQQVIIQPSPHVQFNAIPIVCSNTPPFNITQTTELTNIPGSFSYSGRGISASGVFDPQVAGVGTHILLYKYRGANGCTDSAYQNISTHASPKVNAGNDTSIVIGQPLQLQVMSGTAITFRWTPPDYLDNPAIPNPIATIHSNIDLIKYLVTATDLIGCLGQDSIKVHVFTTLPDIFVPTAFTPGNAINNIFRPIPVGIVSLQYFRIYNRWGQLIYSTSKIGAGWDGRISGELQATGTFVWVVQGTTYLGKIISKRGTMVLIR
jgi:gliding motility-associated-like protein